MAFKKLYKAQFSNTQVDYSDNSANPQDVFITIENKAHEAIANPYGIEFSAVETNPGINITINLTINSDTSNYSNVSVEASADGSTWTEVLTQANPVQGTDYINLISYETYTQYLVKFTLISPPDEEVVYIQEDVIIPIETAEDPVIISVVDTNEDKFTPIRSKSCTIRLLTSNDIDVSTFTSGGDKDFAVTIAVGAETNIIFSGLLSVEDIHQEFQPHPNILSLTATDGLGFLKDIPFPGADMLGDNKIIDYIATCLQLTGLSLEILVENNIREETAGLTDAGHLYNFCYLHTGTFESAPNEFDDCYTVLEKILGESCELSLQKNKWYIKRIDEFDVQDNKQCLFNADGTIDGFLTDVRYEKNIGADNSQYTLAFMNDDAVISRTRPLKSVSHLFNYVTGNYPCNSDFINGDFIGVPDPDEPTWKTYELDCWELMTDSPLGLQDNEAFISRKFDDLNTEIERYAEITCSQSYSSDWMWLESTAIPVDQSNKMTFGFDWRLSNDLDIGGVTLLVGVRLEGSDGNTYWLRGSGFWDENTSIGLWLESQLETAELDQWKSYSYLLDGTSSPANEPHGFPVDGDLYFMIVWANRADYVGTSLNIQHFQFNHTVKIQGSLIDNYTGQQHISEQSGNYIGKREKEVFISDSPARVIKGSLLKLVSGKHVRTEGFWNFAVFPGGVPSPAYIKPFGEMQNQDVWNQYNRPMTVIDGTIDGLDTDKTDLFGLIDIPDLMHTYYVKDSHSAVNNRQFKLLHCSQDFDLCQCDIYLCEVLNETVPKTYTGHTFKYVTNDRQ